MSGIAGPNLLVMNRKFNVTFTSHNKITKITRAPKLTLHPHPPPLQCDGTLIFVSQLIPEMSFNDLVLFLLVFKGDGEKGSCLLALVKPERYN